MPTLALLLLSLGTDATVSRSVESPQTIGATVLRLAVGAVAREIGGGIGDVVAMAQSRGNVQFRLRELPTPAIDGRAAAGWRGWLRAAGRIAGYLADVRSLGSVRWAGGLRHRGIHVAWSVIVQDDRLTIAGDLRGIPDLDLVRLVIVASEHGRSTTIRGTATGWTRYGDRCRLVRRIARRKITTGLDQELLAVIETAGRELYQGGDPRAAIVHLVDSLRRSRSPSTSAAGRPSGRSASGAGRRTGRAVPRGG